MASPPPRMLPFLKAPRVSFPQPVPLQALPKAFPGRCQRDPAGPALSQILPVLGELGCAGSPVDCTLSGNCLAAGGLAGVDLRPRFFFRMLLLDPGRTAGLQRHALVRSRFSVCFADRLPLTVPGPVRLGVRPAFAAASRVLLPAGALSLGFHGVPSGIPPDRVPLVPDRLRVGR